MTVFLDYARYYDLLYQDKDYPAEAGYIVGIIRRHSPDAKSILELGCGTGRHDVFFAEAGFEVAGLDFSQSMIDLAEDRRQKLGPDIRSRISFQVADIRNFRLDRQFDAVISLFHVISYLPNNEDIKMAFDNVHRHLKPGGLFLFDFWYGPAVLTQKPEIRTKTLENDEFRIQRTAQPEILYNDNTVDVIYDLAIHCKTTKQAQKVHEEHRLRYLFLPEIRYFLKDSGLKFLFAEEWMSGRSPGPDTWGVCCAAVAL